MTKTLLLMRHAKSDWSNHQDDFERPLNQRGITDVPKVARALMDDNLYPDIILSSTATRARQTTDSLCHTMGLNVEKIIWMEELYLADQATLLHALQTHLTAVGHTILLVAHNPGMDELTRLLSLEPPPRTLSGKLMTTAAVAVFRLAAEENLGDGHELRKIIRPREL